MGLGVMLVNFCDFLFTTLTIMSVGLAVWHAFDDNIGTEFDWLVAIIFGFITIGYDVIVRYTVEITWNRLDTVKLTVIYVIVHFLVMRVLMKDSDKEYRVNKGCSNLDSLK